MITSSQIIAFADQIKSASCDCTGIEHVESSLRSSIGILNIECDVRPPGSSKDAIPNDATQRIIDESFRNM